MTNRVFVYGTLKQGQSNYSLIESYVSSVTEAETAGWLFDLGAYPAALEGCGTIRGQLLEFNPECMAQAFETMDRLEGVNVDNPLKACTRGLLQQRLLMVIG